MPYPPYYGAAVAQPSHTETSSRPSAPVRSYTQQPERVALLGLQGLRGLVPRVDQIAATAGSALGGAGIGYVASPGKEGPLRGALMGVGLSTLGDALSAARVRNWGGTAVSGVIAVAATGYALWRMQKKRRL